MNAARNSHPLSAHLALLQTALVSVNATIRSSFRMLVSAFSASRCRVVPVDACTAVRLYTTSTVSLRCTHAWTHELRTWHANALPWRSLSSAFLRKSWACSCRCSSWSRARRRRLYHTRYPSTWRGTAMRCAHALATEPPVARARRALSRPLTPP